MDIHLNHDVGTCYVLVCSHVLPGLQEAAALRFAEGRQTASEEVSTEMPDRQKIDKSPENGDISGNLKLEKGVGSAWGIRTPDLRLERAVS